MTFILSYWSGLPTEGRIVSLIIIVLAVIACAILRMQFAWLRNEEEAQITRIGQSPRPQSSAAAHALIDKDKHADSAVARVLDAVLNTGQFDGDLMDLSERIHWSRYFAGVFVFLGLLGTVWGIASAVASLGGAVSSLSGGGGEAANASAFTLERWSKLLEGIESLLTGMKSAFFCTLCGLGATLLVSFLNSAYIKAADELQAQARQFAVEWLVPLFLADRQVKLPQSQVDRLDATLAYLLASANTLSADAAQLAATTGELASALDPAVTHLANVVSSADDTAQNLEAAVATMQAETAQAMQRLQAGQDTLAASALQLAHATAYTDKIQGSVDALTSAAELLPEHHALMEGASQAVSASATRMEKAVRDLQEKLADANARQGKTLQDVVAGLDAAHKTLRDLLRQFETTLADVAAVSEQSPLRADALQLRQEITSELKQLQTQVYAVTTQMEREGAAQAERERATQLERERAAQTERERERTLYLDRERLASASSPPPGGNYRNNAPTRNVDAPVSVRKEDAPAPSPAASPSSLFVPAAVTVTRPAAPDARVSSRSEAEPVLEAAASIAGQIRASAPGVGLNSTNAMPPDVVEYTPLPFTPASQDSASESTPSNAFDGSEAATTTVPPSLLPPSDMPYAASHHTQSGTTVRDSPQTEPAIRAERAESLFAHILRWFRKGNP